MFNSVTKRSYTKDNNGKYFQYDIDTSHNAKNDLLNDFIYRELKFSHIKRITKKVVTSNTIQVIFTVYHDNGNKVVYTCEK